MTAGVEWLSSTSGIPLSDPRNDAAGLYRSYDPIKYTLEKELIERPGSSFNYSTGITTVLGEILKTASGLNPDKFAAKYLLSPLGIEHYKWHKYPNGTIDTGGGLCLRSRDMAKIGYLMLKKGKWKDNQIVSEQWVEEATKAHVKQVGDLRTASDYGYQWHCGESRIKGQSIEVFFAQGLGGQYIIVLPGLNSVVVFTCQHPDSSGWLNGNLVLTNHIIPSMLPASQQQKGIKSKSKDIDRFVGEYELKPYNEKVVVGKKDKTLYFHSPDKPKVMIYPEAEDTFYGTHDKLGEIKVIFTMDEQKNVKEFVLGIGFQSLHYEKVK
jgi:CubicO group peptidase (beta-lactamase class C family)